MVKCYSDVMSTIVLNLLIAKRVIDVVLKYYQTDDPAIIEKIEFGLLVFEIGRAYQQVRNSVGQSKYA